MSSRQNGAGRRDGLLAGALAFAALLWLFAWYGETVLSTVAIWQRSQTFAHGFLIFPISAYLIWTRRQRLARLVPQPSFSALIVLAGLGFVWLLANLAGVIVVQQYALVAMIPNLVWRLLGKRFFWALFFPLAFLFFSAILSANFLFRL